MLVDVIIEVLEKHKIDKSVIDDELAQAIASDVGEQLQDMDAHNMWSTEARELFTETLKELKFLKVHKTESSSVQWIELGNLIFKIEELLIKH